MGINVNQSQEEGIKKKNDVIYRHHKINDVIWVLMSSIILSLSILNISRLERLTALCWVNKVYKITRSIDFT